MISLLDFILNSNTNYISTQFDLTQCSDCLTKYIRLSTKDYTIKFCTVGSKN